jgi:HK97 family phage prohead protease
MSTATDLALAGLARRVAALEGQARQRHADIALRSVQKFMSDGKRVLRGIASTSSLDLQGDIVVPAGGQWTLPVPLLFGHSHADPIGWVRDLAVRGEALHCTCEVASGLRRADEVWAMLEQQLVAAFSIGFLGLRGTPIPTGTRWDSWRLLELSAVVVPANPDARITATRAQVDGSVKLRAPSAGSVRLLKR